MLSRKSRRLRFRQLQAAAPANNFFSASSSSLSERPYSFISLSFGAWRISVHSSATALRGGLRPVLTRTSASSAYHSSILGMSDSSSTNRAPPPNRTAVGCRFADSVFVPKRIEVCGRGGEIQWFRLLRKWRSLRICSIARWTNETELLFLLSRTVLLEVRLQLFDGGEIPPQFCRQASGVLRQRKWDSLRPGVKLLHI